MKREEKNQLKRRSIMKSALAEFSKQGYGGSSINTICSAQGISKGIIYHYFKTKDDLFLACLEECFTLLTNYIEDETKSLKGGMEEQLEIYFTARLSFFAKYPVYQRIFCDAVVTPPDHLKDQIHLLKKSFDDLNIEILEKLLAPIPLRSPITKEEVIDTFRQFQDYINAHYQTTELELHEKRCKSALNILLYGVIERK